MPAEQLTRQRRTATSAVPDGSCRLHPAPARPTLSRPSGLLPRLGEPQGTPRRPFQIRLFFTDGQGKAGHREPSFPKGHRVSCFPSFSDAALLLLGAASGASPGQCGCPASLSASRAGRSRSLRVCGDGGPRWPLDEDVRGGAQQDRPRQCAALQEQPEGGGSRSSFWSSFCLQGKEPGRWCSPSWTSLGLTW